MLHRLVALGLVAIATAGCGARCAEIATRKRALIERTAKAAGPHAQVRVPLARANAFLAALVHDQPLRVELPIPRLGPFMLPPRELTAVARDVELRPSPADRLRFAIRVAIEDAQGPITTLAIETEVKPQLVRTPGATELVAGFGPANLLRVKPELTAESGHALVDAVARWLPPAIRDRTPRALLDAAAQLLAEYLTGGAYFVLQRTMLQRLGELTRLRLELPALPIASMALPPTGDALTIDLLTDLPVRRGLATTAAASDDVVVRLSGSTAAELANWSIEHGPLPQRYTRDLEPDPGGDYRPRFDYLAGERRPVKVHVFQERGGCSYFQVGLALRVAIVEGHLVVDALDRLVEEVNASRPLELALWFKQLILGSVDSSRRAAAHTRLTLGDRAFTTRVVRAALAGDELALALELTPEPVVKATNSIVR